MVRTIDDYDDDSIKGPEADPKKKESLAKLYDLSNNIHSHHISAPDRESLNKIIAELDENNLIIDKNLIKNK